MLNIGRTKIKRAEASLWKSCHYDVINIQSKRAERHTLRLNLFHVLLGSQRGEHICGAHCIQYLNGVCHSTELIFVPVHWCDINAIIVLPSFRWAARPQVDCC